METNFLGTSLSFRRQKILNLFQKHFFFLFQNITWTSSRCHNTYVSVLLFTVQETKNTGVGSHSLLQGIFLTQELNLHLLHCRQIIYRLIPQGSPFLSTRGDRNQFPRIIILFQKTIEFESTQKTFFFFPEHNLSIILMWQHRTHTLVFCFSWSRTLKSWKSWLFQSVIGLPW